jgi:competence protein ComEA
MKEKWYYYVVFVTLIVIIGVYYVNSQSFDTIEVQLDVYNNQNENTNNIQETDDVVEKGKVCIHICGAVANEGVYEVNEGSRVYEALELAGGLTDEAATDYVNQARVVKDGEKIIFPTKKQIEAGDFVTEDNDRGVVNINTASIDKLMTLSGIGESRAKLIVEYRQQHGGFNKIQDIMKVSGIKEGSFNKIKDSITVN